MDEHLDERFGEEADKLHQLFLRTAVASLVLLYFVLAGLATAVSRTESEAEVRAQFARITSADLREVNPSWVFSNHIQSLPESNEGSSEEVVQDVRRRLEVLAAEWFSVSFDFLGTSVRIDLRILGPLLPFLVFGTIAYLLVIRRKIAVLEAAQRMAAADAAATRPWQRQAFQTHPHVLAQWAFALGALVLLSWMGQVFDSMRPLISEDLQADYLNAMICAAWCFALYVNYASAQMGDGTVRRWTPLGLSRLVLNGAWWVVAAARDRFPRTQLGTGAALVFLTLVLSLGVSCQLQTLPFDGSGDSVSGYDFITDDDAMWFSSDLPMFSIAIWGLYIGMLVVSAWSLVVAVLLWRSRSRAARIAVHTGRFVCVSMAALTTGTIVLFCRSPELRQFGDIAGQVWAILVGIWVLFARRRSADYAHRLEMVGLFIVAAGGTFGLQAAVFLWRRGLIGIPVLLFGTLLQYRVYSSLARQTGVYMAAKGGLHASPDVVARGGLTSDARDLRPASERSAAGSDLASIP